MYEKLYIYFLKVCFNFHAAISCSRYICTFLPFKAHLITSSTVKRALAFCLLYPVVIAATTSLAFLQLNSYLPCLVFTVYPPGLVIFYCSHIFVSLLATCYIYIRILRESIRHQRAIAALDVNSQPTETTDQQADNYRRNIALLKNFSIIFGIFAISHLPYSILACAISVDPMRYLMNVNIITSLQIITFMLFLNSMINPFVYAWRSRSFRAAFRIILCRLRASEIAEINEQFNIN